LVKLGATNYLTVNLRKLIYPELQLRIRNYTANDLGVCRSLWAEMVQRHRDIYEDQTIGGDDPGLEFDKHLELVGFNNIWLAESEDQVIGFTSLIIKEQEAEIEPIIVSNKKRGEGVGELLINHAVEEARKQNILCIYVRPVVRNKEAISFFYNCGFKTVGHIQLFKWLGEESSDTWQEGLEIFGKSFKY
jgi:N-acetylglutamate synthase-like GNAT family acetyltransferase